MFTNTELDRLRSRPVEYLHIDGLTLPLRRYRAKTEGAPAVLLLHGANTSSDMFLLPDGGIIRHLQRGWDVWTLDWRGSPLVLDRVLEEELCMDALAHQPALHVGEGDDDRVDRAGLDVTAQLVDGDHANESSRAIRSRSTRLATSSASDSRSAGCVVVTPTV